MNNVRRHAFTLVELMVVVAIVGLLATILFPVFSQAKEAAKKMTCISNLRNMALGTIMYTDDHDGGSYQTQMIAYGNAPNGKPLVNEYTYWYGLVWKGEIYPEYSPVWPYLKSREIQQCASARGYYRSSSNVTTVGFAPNTGTFGNLGQAKNIASMMIPSETIMYADSSYWTAATGLSYPSTGTMSCGGTSFGSIHARHTGAVGSISWWDGHVKAQSLWYSQGTTVQQKGFAKNHIGTLLKFSKNPSDLTKPVGNDDSNVLTGPTGYDCYYYQSITKIQP